MNAIDWARRADEETKAGRLPQMATACPECHGYQKLVTWDGGVIDPTWDDGRNVKRCRCEKDWVYAYELTDSLGLTEATAAELRPGNLQSMD